MSGCGCSPRPPWNRAAALKPVGGPGRASPVARPAGDGRAQPPDATTARLIAAIRDDPRLGGRASFTARDTEARYVRRSGPPGTTGAAACLSGATPEREHRVQRHLHGGGTFT